MRASRIRAKVSLARTLFFGLLLAVGLVFAPFGLRPVHAQGNWWDGLKSGVPDFSGRSRDQTYSAPRKPEPLADLRPDPVPWCSATMFNAIADGIARYERIVANGGWPEVPRGRMMRAGDDDPRVPILRKRLRISGDLASKSQYYNSQTFDGELEEAVVRFQIHNGLRPTGRIEQSVYATLNITAQQRLEQLRLNLVRLQGLNCGSEPRYVFVNVPAYQLEAVEQYEARQRHRVIVGREGRETPDVRATIKALNFFPYWHVPESIATLDLIPRMQKDPQYLQEEDIRIYDGYNGPEVNPATVNWTSPEVAKFKFRQEPGAKNALGLVRLDMTNKFGVYMHDTPMKNLFNQRSRAFSAGCVRVQSVFELAEWIAKDEPGWEQPGRVEQVLAGGQAFDLTLTHPVPVYFAYVTAWVDPSTREVQFRPDIYGRDQPQSQQFYARDEDDAPPAAAANALAP